MTARRAAATRAAADTSAGGGPTGGRGAKTRRKLLDAAETVFAAVGYHDASIVKITELAEVAQGTFYLYFKGKQQVFDEVVGDLNHRVRQVMAEASAGAPTRLEAERRGFAAFFRFTAEHPALYRVIRQAEFVSPAALRHHYERIVEGYVPSLLAAMATGEVAETDPTVLAWSLIAIGEAVGMRWILWEGSSGVPVDVFEATMEVVARLLAGGAVEQEPVLPREEPAALATQVAAATRKGRRGGGD